MLKDHPAILQVDPILSFLAGGRPAQRIAEGVYEIHHFGSSRWPQGASDTYEYGVCDNYEQVILHHSAMIQAPDRKFVITLTPIVKADQPARGGWRWHKWGEYIGVLSPQREYIFDEDDSIEKVYVFHIYELDD